MMLAINLAPQMHVKLSATGDVVKILVVEKLSNASPTPDAPNAKTIIAYFEKDGRGSRLVFNGAEEINAAPTVEELQ